MNDSSFKTIPGTNPILLSAPHAYAHKRPRLNMSYKQGEIYTDKIVQEISDSAKTFGIYLSKECDFDPNYHKEKSNPYKQKVVEIVKENKIEYFIDIHGLKDGNMYDIAIYYPTKFSRSKNLAIYLQDRLNKGKLRGLNISIFRFLDNHQETLGEFVASKLRIPSVQIEIAKDIGYNKDMRDSFIDNLNNSLGKLII